MAHPESKVVQFILHSLVPILCSIAVGFIFYQDGVFDRTQGAFQFLWSAVVASVFYYLLLFLRSRDAYLGLLLLLMLTFLTTHSTSPVFILRDILYIGAIGASILIYVRYFKQSEMLNYAYAAVSLAGIYGMMYIITAEIHLAIIRGFGVEYTGGNFGQLAATGAFFGTLIGFAVGAGITIATKLFGQVKNV